MRNVSLRRKLIVSIVSLLSGALLFALLGTYLYLSIEERKFYAVLSPEAKAAYALDWSETGMPDPSLVEEISLAEEKYLGPSYENEFWVFTSLSVIAMLVGFLISLVISRKLTNPLEQASISAKIIAEGDFTHHMGLSDNTTLEVRSLVESFEYLTQSLQKMEDNIRYTSASIAHELRTPLTVIQGYIQGIRDGVFEADDAQLDLILGHISGLSHLIDDLKLISLAETGQFTLKTQACDIRACLQEAVTFMRPEFQKMKRDVIFESFSEPCLMKIDPERIKQVIIALLSNALRHSKSGAPCTISYSLDEDGTVISVSDTGQGFSKAALERASDRFWRGDAARQKNTGGSGLGLSVVKAIVDANNGTMSLSNNKDGGATVMLHLPKTLG